MRRTLNWWFALIERPALLCYSLYTVSSLNNVEQHKFILLHVFFFCSLLFFLEMSWMNEKTYLLVVTTQFISSRYHLLYICQWNSRNNPMRYSTTPPCNKIKILKDEIKSFLLVIYIKYIYMKNRTGYWKLSIHFFLYQLLLNLTIMTDSSVISSKPGCSYQLLWQWSILVIVVMLT